ncbi:MAG: hypothetical protein IJ695_01535 [Butyrivibrio sp.]|nr:hypothetical protein [Butyrivibrio sp.]
MAFDISKLTEGVNKYLNSISEVGKAAQKINEELEARSRFSVELGEAIKQNIQSRLKGMDSVPDIEFEVKSAVSEAIASLDNTFNQIDGAFESIKSAGKVMEVTDSTGADAAKSDTGEEVKDKNSAAEAITALSGNRNAYAGVLSTEALQELSKSQYFSANLVQSSLFDTGNEDSSDESSSGPVSGLAGALASSNSYIAGASSDPFKSLSLTDLNNNSLLQNELVKAYSASAKNAAVNNTSIFGDFTL